MAGDDPEVAALPAGGGLSWSWDLDLDALLAAVCDRTVSDPGTSAGAACADRIASVSPESDPAEPDPAEPDPAEPDPAEPDPAEPDPVEADFAEYLEAVDGGRSEVLPLSSFTGLVAESLPASPDLAGWLAQSSASTADEHALTGLASSYRRLASWAQAGELAAVAQLAARSAAADARIGVDEKGRPTRISPDACGQVSLALTMSQASASWWSDLAVTLEWRLAETGSALRSGQLDLSRARAIAEATAVLDEESARAVESRVLPRAGEQTLGQLRSALRRAVIAEDPQGAERRREEAERRARVTLHPDAEGTAGLAGYCLPGVRAAAAMARITALARALKASGAGGGIDLLRSKVFLGLLLGTLPYIPPAPDGPPDDGCPPGEDSPSDDRPPHQAPSDDPPSPISPAWWPEVNAFVRPGPAAMGHLLPAGGGLLDLRVQWSTLTGAGTEPGYLGRLGAITPVQASYLAQLAASDPSVDWRVIVTGADGSALAVGGIRRRSARAGPGPPDRAAAHDDYCGLIKRVTVTLARDELAPSPAASTGTGTSTRTRSRTSSRTSTGDLSLPARLAQVLAAAKVAADRAALVAAADAAAADPAGGGCAHSEATGAYRPSSRLAEYVTARDVTCRFPTCRQPASRCDLDHTVPFDQGGKTCACNLGGLCRYHHQLKQHSRWQLAQPRPGTFAWITPAGRVYDTRPDSHAA